MDLPSYAELNNKYMLAEKSAKGWHNSDPLALTVSFKSQVKEKGERLHRIVRYLKAWADFQSGRRGKMPSGLILTVLAAQNFHTDDRDDVSLADTVKSISGSVHPVFCVYNPVDSDEELTARLTNEQNLRFQEAISDLTYDGAKAVDIDDRNEASKIWRKQLGDRFPVIEKDADKIEQKQRDAAKLASFYVAKNPPKPWGYF